MVTFKDYAYTRPNMDELKAEVTALIEQFKVAETFEAQSEVIKQINKHRNSFSTMAIFSVLKISL